MNETDLIAMPMFMKVASIVVPFIGVAVISVQFYLIAIYVLTLGNISQDLCGPFAAFVLIDLPTDDLAAIDVHEQIQIKEHALVRGVPTSLVYEPDAGCKRSLSIAPKHTLKSLLRCFRELGHESGKRVGFVCSDIWKPYFRVLNKEQATCA